MAAKCVSAAAAQEIPTGDVWVSPLKPLMAPSSSQQVLSGGPVQPNGDVWLDPEPSVENATWRSPGCTEERRQESSLCS
jgi:hypothetical protein